MKLRIWLLIISALLAWNAIGWIVAFAAMLQGRAIAEPNTAMASFELWLSIIVAMAAIAGMIKAIRN